MTKYKYNCQAVRIVDGDTIDLKVFTHTKVDVGFGIMVPVPSIDITERIRLAGIDTPELNSSDKKERIRAQTARMYVINWIEQVTMFGRFPLVIYTDKDKRGKFGRYIATVWDRDETECLNDQLVNLGYAVRVSY